MDSHGLIDDNLLAVLEPSLRYKDAVEPNTAVVISISNLTVKGVRIVVSRLNETSPP